MNILIPLANRKKKKRSSRNWTGCLGTLQSSTAQPAACRAGTDGSASRQAHSFRYLGGLGEIVAEIPRNIIIVAPHVPLLQQGQSGPAASVGHAGWSSRNTRGDKACIVFNWWGWTVADASLDPAPVSLLYLHLPWRGRSYPSICTNLARDPRHVCCRSQSL